MSSASSSSDPSGSPSSIQYQLISSFLIWLMSSTASLCSFSLWIYFSILRYYSTFFRSASSSITSTFSGCSPYLKVSFSLVSPVFFFWLRTKLDFKDYLRVLNCLLSSSGFGSSTWGSSYTGRGSSSTFSSCMFITQIKLNAINLIIEEYHISGV